MSSVGLLKCLHCKRMHSSHVRTISQSGFDRFFFFLDSSTQTMEEVDVFFRWEAQVRGQKRGFLHSSCCLVSALLMNKECQNVLDSTASE